MPIGSPARVLLSAALLWAAWAGLSGPWTDVFPADARAVTATAERQDAPHYREFTDVEALAAYLAPDSAAGPLISAHRGGPAPGYPENAIETFEHALRAAACVLECDVRLTSDGVPVLLHDRDLDRTTTGEGPLARHTLAEIRPLRLRDEDGTVTPFAIPTLAEALCWAEARAVLTLDIKRGVPARAVVAAIRAVDAADRVTVIASTPDVYRAFRKLAPDLVYSVTARDADTLAAYRRLGLRLDRTLVFVGVGRFDEGFVRNLRRLGIRPILGTFGKLDRAARREDSTVFADLIDDGIGMLATDDVESAARALATPGGVRAR